MRDNEESTPPSPDMTNLSTYEQFLRRNLPRLVRNAIETEVNNEIQPVEERLRGQIPDIVEHALSHAFLEYRAMADKNQNADPLLDSGYISSHSRSSLSQVSKGKEPVRDLPAESSVLSKADSNNAPESSGALLSPLIGAAPIPNFESTSLTHQSFASMSSSEYLQFQDPMSNDFLSPEEVFVSDLSFFPDQYGDPISNMIDLDSSNRDFSHKGDSSSHYAI